ncbi:hypothetical protein [Sphingomonas sp. PB4P5]|uniref:hypothetical protein n=1 Tax=Parasphingomonas puruogangriensis TaxID=3096155 RepID=UPI002FCC65AF
MLLLLALALAACNIGVDRVDVSGSAQDLRFAAVSGEGEEPACIKTASVSQVEPEEAQPVWRVTALHSDKCVSIISYGRETAELAQEAPALNLRPDVSYRVRMSGGGFSLTRDFSISPTGDLTVLD